NEPIVMYPNPTEGWIHIKGSFQSVQIMAIDGRLLRTTTDMDIDVTDLLPGVYLLRFHAKDQVPQVQKLVRQ
ncbi:MAG: hypothetical protein ACI83D_000729, partial [Planctomycetota bacterium]